MPSNSRKIKIYLEIGSQRVFAGAPDWPGWCRSGKDEEAAVRALFDYRLRYERALKGAELDFLPPEKEFRFIDRRAVEGRCDDGFRLAR